jgi:hypothetical protein
MAQRRIFGARAESMRRASFARSVVTIVDFFAQQARAGPRHGGDGGDRRHCRTLKNGTFWHFLALYPGAFGADLQPQKRLRANRPHFWCHFLALTCFHGGASPLKIGHAWAQHILEDVEK